MIRAALCVLIFSSAGVAQNTKTILDGVYTEAQAARGEAIFQKVCFRCHGEALQGRSDPALKGDGFIDRWREDNLNTLYTHVRTRMPPRLAGAAPPGSFSDNDYLDLVSYILHENSYPAGKSELTAEAAANILFVGKEGPRSLPTNAQAVIVGCLAPGANNIWMLNNATEPLRTRNVEETDEAELRLSAAKLLGTLTFRLRNFPDFRPGLDPQPWKGHRVQVKGALIRQPGNDRITVLSAESAASVCP